MSSPQPEKKTAESLLAIVVDLMACTYKEMQELNALTNDGKIRSFTEEETQKIKQTKH